MQLYSMCRRISTKHSEDRYQCSNDEILTRILTNRARSIIALCRVQILILLIRSFERIMHVFQRGEDLSSLHAAKFQLRFRV